MRAPSAVAHGAVGAEAVERLVRLDEMRPMGRHDRGEMRLELAPDGLGPIEVRVSVREDAVHASLWAHHDQARETLAANRPALEAALERSQLRLEGFTVGLGEHRRDEQGEGTRDGGRPAAFASAAAATAASAPPTIRPTWGAGLSLRA
jgi:flagellar hook-length control protein FliK